jgi:two-component system chemotaxis response regulator CheY
MSYDFAEVKILIVEDMQPMLHLSRTLLGLMGLKNIQGAKNAEDGFRMFCHANHDLIITDWLMEPYDGLDFIKMVRRDDRSPNKFVPVIMMTGYSDRQRVESARDMGVTEFLMKPFSAKDMYARIVQIIEKPRQFVDTGEFFGPDRRRRKNFDFHGENRRGNSDKNIGAFGEPNPEIDLMLRDLQDETKRI